MNEGVVGSRVRNELDERKSEDGEREGEKEVEGKRINKCQDRKFIHQSQDEDGSLFQRLYPLLLLLIHSDLMVLRERGRER